MAGGGGLSSIWKEAVAIPIRKPGKDPTNPTSYRPISLTSNLCKIMERMIVDRLTYVLEEDYWQIVKVDLGREEVQ